MAFPFKEVLIGHKTGRIFAYDLKTKQVKLIISGLAFPNGIVYEATTNSIIFSELNRFTIWKYNIDTTERKALH